MEVRGAAELRVKESDRISALAARASARWAPRSTSIPTASASKRGRLDGGDVVDAAGDHRLAMAFAVAATGAATPTTITGAGAVDVSYPGFFEELERLTTPGDGRQDLSRRVHGGGQEHRRAGARRASGLAGRGRRRADRSARAPARRGHLRAAGRAVLPRRRARDPQAAAAAAPRRRRDRRRDLHGRRESRGDEPRRRVGLARRAVRDC